MNKDITGRSVFGHDEDGKPVYSYDDFGRPIYQAPWKQVLGYHTHLKDKYGNKIIDYNARGDPIIGFDQDGKERVNENDFNERQ